MANNELPSLEEWKQLYDTVIQVRETAPWEWMNETSIFGVRDPETNDLGFISVMGILGEHCAISVYLGTRGLYDFLKLQSEEVATSPENILEIPQLQASFEDRNMLQQDDIEIIKKLGYRFRGRKKWPLFRSYRPGFMPWFLEAREARFLRHVLEQTILIALDVKKNPLLLEFQDERNYLIRIPYQGTNNLIWKNRIMHIPPPEPFAISININMHSLFILKSLSPGKNKVEIDLFMSPTPVREKKTRPFFPYILMMVDVESSMIICNEILSPCPSMETMWSTVPSRIINQLARIGIMPGEFFVRSDMLYQLLHILNTELGIEINLSYKLPILDQAKKLLIEYLR